MPADHTDQLAVSRAFGATSRRFHVMGATEQADQMARSARLVQLAASGEQNPEKLRAAMRQMKAEQGR